MKSKLSKNRVRRKDEQEQEHHEMENDLNRYGIRLIKVIGIAGAILGIIILFVFWGWLLSKLF